MATYNNEEGVWRTIGGRRVFIRTGQSLSDAMIESGKFSRVKKNEELYKKLDEEKEPKLTRSQKEAGERLNKKAQEGVRNDIKDFLSGRENYDGSQEEFINDLSQEWGVDKNDVEDILNEEMKKHPRLFKNERKNNPYARNNEGGSDDNTSAFAQEAIDHWNKKNEEYKSQYGKDDEMAKSFVERWEKEKASRLKGEKYEQAVKDWENGKITDDEMYEIFDGNETKIKYNFERMGYKAPTKENIDKTNAEQLTAFGEKKEFTREELKARYGTDNVDLINAGRESENRVKLKEDNKKETTFTSQSTNPFYDDTTYSKEQLDKMKENKIKPMANTYSGRGWEGTNYDSNLSTKEIAKNITDYSKKEFPDVKLSRKTDYNSMDINIMSSAKDMYASASDIDKMSDKQVSDTIRDSIGGYTNFDRWLDDNNKKSANGTFTAKEEREYLKEQLNEYKNRKGARVVGDEWYLSDYGKKVATGLNREMNSYNFDDDDPMTDYFHSNFYGYVNIGKWDKPYEVKETTTNSKMNDTIRQKAFQKYKKEHPRTEKTLEDFM